MVGLVAATIAPVAAAAALAEAVDLDRVATVLCTVAGAVLGAGCAVVLAAASQRRAVVVPLRRRLAGERLARADVEARSRSLEAGIALRDRFDRAAATVDGEAALLRLMLRAAVELLAEDDVALLLSLPDEPRVAWSVRMLADQLVPAVPVPDRPGCVALATGRTATTVSSTELGACAHLDPASLGSAASAVCVPLRLVDHTLGVVCATGPPGELPAPEHIATLEHLVSTTGDRLARLRRRRGPSTPGPTDPVTGLPTGVAFRSRMAELVRAHVPFCVAVLRVDGTRDYQRSNGPEAWDDAMRLLGDTTSGTLRPDDVVCRLDGDRIAAVLAGCSTVQAAAALERVRESLVLAHTVAGMAHFTCSVGLTDGARGTSVDEVVRLADAAGETALLQGGNRVVVADPSTC